jgi:hypothetical protein
MAREAATAARADEQPGTDHGGRGANLPPLLHDPFDFLLEQLIR